MTEVEEFENLTKQLSERNAKISSLLGKREEQAKQLERILKENGVTSVAELEKKFEAIKEKAEAVKREVSQYLEVTGAALSQLDSILSETK